MFSRIWTEEILFDGAYDTVHYAIMEQDRSILICLPDVAEQGIRYPVMYILDGESHFIKMLGVLDQLSNIKHLHSHNTILKITPIVSTQKSNWKLRSEP